MSKKILLIVTTLMLLTMVVAMPALADGKISVVVNQDVAKQLDVVVQDGNVMVSAQAWARLAGADVVAKEDGYQEILENGVTLAVKPGQSQALLNGKAVTAPAASKTGDTVYIPLRFVAETFGFEVDWDHQGAQVVLTRNETRDNLTAEELLVKANQAVAEVNTYNMDGKLQTSFNISADGLQTEAMSTDMSIEMTGQLQNKPLQAYIVQKMDLGLGLEDEGDLSDMAMEIYMTEQNMYMKAPGQDWMVMEMPFSADFWKEQQDIQSDPLKALAQMKNWGLLLNYGNDVVIDGKSYYVVNATMDVEKFMSSMQNVMQQAIPNFASEISTDEMEQFMQQLQKILAESKIDFYYTVYINKDTMLTDLVKMDLQMDLNMNTADFALDQDLADAEEKPEHIRVIMGMQGDFKISDLGAPFVAPDVKNAQPVSAMQDIKVTP